MNNACEVYNYSQRLENEINRINLKIKIKENQQTILRFHREIIAQGVGTARQIKYLTTLRIISNKLGKEFPKITKEDIIDFIAYLENSHYSEWTKRDFRLILKRFFKWLYELEEGYPTQVKWIKVKRSIKSNIRKKDLLTANDIEKMAQHLLTANDIEKMAQHATHPRDRAFIWPTYCQ